MDLGSLLLGLALLLASAFIVARPLFEPQGLLEKDLGPTETLLAQRDLVLTALRDLDFDHATGKITDEDYAPQRARLVAEGAAILKQLDEHRVAPRALDSVEAAIRARRKTPARADSAIESAIAARRAAPLERITCSVCGAAAGAADKFCPKCGASLGSACPACGHAVRPTDKFCGSCGAQIAAAEAA